MSEMNQAKILLEDYNFWNVPDTWYERQDFGDSASTFRFGCHQQHTTITIKIDQVAFVEANTP